MMMKSIAVAAALALMGGTPTLAQSWAFVAKTEGAVWAVDWDSLSYSGDSRKISVAMVNLEHQPDSFDYGIVSMEIDCRQMRFAGLQGSFFDRTGDRVTEDYVAPHEWVPVAEGTAIGDVREAVCQVNPPRTGPFNSAHDFATNAWRVVEEGN